MPRSLAAASVLAAVLLTAACGGSGDTGPTASGASGASSGSGTPVATESAPSALPKPSGTPVTKMLVVVVENHSLDQMRSGMAHTSALGDTYGYATRYSAITHPSLPNYLAMTGGSTYGVTNDASPSTNGVHGPSVFGQALAQGKTARLYAEGMPEPCRTSDGGDRYAVRHNPWAYHLDERAACQADDVSIDRLAPDVAAGDLPHVGMLIPDTCNDAHDCDLATADRWLRTQLDLVMSGRDWKSGHLLVVVTADEDDHHQDNLVLTTVMHPGLQQRVVDVPLTHYSLARAYSEVVGAEPLGEAAQATSLLAAFGLRV